MVDDMAELVQHEPLDAPLTRALVDRRQVERDGEALGAALGQPDRVRAARARVADVDRDQAVDDPDQAARLGACQRDLVQDQRPVGGQDRRAESQARGLDVVRDLGPDGLRSLLALIVRVTSGDERDQRDDCEQDQGLLTGHARSIGAITSELEPCG